MAGSSAKISEITYMKIVRKISSITMRGLSLNFTKKIFRNRLSL
jgi:hypothetical protein